MRQCQEAPAVENCVTIDESQHSPGHPFPHWQNEGLNQMALKVPVFWRPDIDFSEHHR